MAARAMLATVFVAGGVRALKNPDQQVPAAKRFTDRITPLIQRIDPRLPTDTRTLVQLNAAVHVAGGLLLLTRLRRPAAVALFASLVPTTYAGHPFWEQDEPGARAQQQTHLTKNLGLMGGLLLAATDTEGRPGLAWRTTHALDEARRTVRRGARRTSSTARVALRAASIGRRLPD
jgi:putative oxidoreductase